MHDPGHKSEPFRVRLGLSFRSGSGLVWKGSLTGFPSVSLVCVLTLVALLVGSRLCCTGEHLRFCSFTVSL